MRLLVALLCWFVTVSPARSAIVELLFDRSRSVDSPHFEMHSSVLPEFSTRLDAMLAITKTALAKTMVALPELTVGVTPWNHTLGETTSLSKRKPLEIGEALSAAVFPVWGDTFLSRVLQKRGLSQEGVCRAFVVITDDFTDARDQPDLHRVLHALKDVPVWVLVLPSEEERWVIAQYKKVLISPKHRVTQLSVKTLSMVLTTLHYVDRCPIS